MASDLAATEVNGINLENYYPSKRSYNSVSYIHKKFFIKSEEKLPAVKDHNDNNDSPHPRSKELKKKTKNTISKHYKTIKTDKDIDGTSLCNEEVLGQTIRFAKNIVPIVIPPSPNERSPIYYTIKTSRKSRNGNNKIKESPNTQESKTYRKQQENKIIETFRKKNFKSHTDSCSHETLSRSSVENIIISHSLNSSTSEQSERRFMNVRQNGKRCGKGHVAASESLEALATELIQTSGEAKIKIHLMDDTAKDLFYESIRTPIMAAIRESVAEIMHRKENEESKTVHRHVQLHNQKLDNILDKLTCIENRLDAQEAQKRIIRGKASALEEIGEDIEDKDDSEEDVLVREQKVRCASAVARLNPLQKIEEVSPCSGDGDDINNKVFSPTICVRPDKMPARFCWTGSNQ